jgi:hypothetical protein
MTLGDFDRGMTKQNRDVRELYAAEQQGHREGVAETMWMATSDRSVCRSEYLPTNTFPALDRCLSLAATAPNARGRRIGQQQRHWSCQDHDLDAVSCPLRIVSRSTASRLLPAAHQTQRRLEDLKPPAHRWPTRLSRRTAFGAPGACRLPQAGISAQTVLTASPVRSYRTRRIWR